MIRIVRPAKEPDALTNARKTRLPKVTPQTLGEDIDGYGVAKKDLAAMQRLLCAYCEVRHMTEKWRDVEHYRPKSAYPWLAWTWENLLFACKECNSDAKGDQFPIRGTKLAFGSPPPGKERPYFLDPSAVGFDFRKHIVFRPDVVHRKTKWRPNGLTPEGRRTVKELRLRRPELVDCYRLHVETSVQMAADALVAHQASASDVADILTRAFQPGAQFRALTHDALQVLLPAPLAKQVDAKALGLV
jgi:hypothetical protein